MADNDDISIYISEDSTLGHGHYKVSNAKCINVMLIGRTQTGKSTLLQTLLNPQKGTTSTGLSDTNDPSMSMLILTDDRTGQSYQINIIDTPGLDETRPDNERGRTDEKLLSLAAECIKRHVTWLNVVCFVTKVRETQMHDAQIFGKLTQFLGEKYSQISMMVVTNCDDFDQGKRDDYMDTIRTHASTSQYYEYCQLGAYPFGAIDVSKLGSIPEAIRKRYVEGKLQVIENFRDAIISKIVSCADNALQIDELRNIFENEEHIFQCRLDAAVQQRSGRNRACTIQ